VCFHRNAFSSKQLFTETAFHRNGFSPKRLFTETPFHRNAFSLNLHIKSPFIKGSFHLICTFSSLALFIEKSFLVYSFSRRIRICSQICSSNIDAQSFQTFLFQTRAILPCISNVVAALPSIQFSTGNPNLQSDLL
jgi:hypothetical protein